jgi:hypothetical protein
MDRKDVGGIKQSAREPGKTESRGAGCLLFFSRDGDSMTTPSRYSLTSIGLVLAIAYQAAMATAVASGQVGDNLAAGRSYTLWPAPDYGHCTDPGDATQLTDGLSTADYFWTQQGTVGWTSPSYARIRPARGHLDLCLGAPSQEPRYSAGSIGVADT